MGIDDDRRLPNDLKKGGDEALTTLKQTAWALLAAENPEIAEMYLQKAKDSLQSSNPLLNEAGINTTRESEPKPPKEPSPIQILVKGAGDIEVLTETITQEESSEIPFHTVEFVTFDQQFALGKYRSERGIIVDGELIIDNLISTVAYEALIQREAFSKDNVVPWYHIRGDLIKANIEFGYRYTVPQYIRPENIFARMNKVLGHRVEYTAEEGERHGFYIVFVQPSIITFSKFRDIRPNSAIRTIPPLTDPTVQNGAQDLAPQTPLPSTKPVYKRVEVPAPVEPRTAAPAMELLPARTPSNVSKRKEKPPREEVEVPQLNKDGLYPLLAVLLFEKDNPYGLSANQKLHMSLTNIYERMSQHVVNNLHSSENKVDQAQMFGRTALSAWRQLQEMVNRLGDAKFTLSDIQQAFGDDERYTIVKLFIPLIDKEPEERQHVFDAVESTIRKNYHLHDEDSA